MWRIERDWIGYNVIEINEMHLQTKGKRIYKCHEAVLVVSNL